MFSTGRLRRLLVAGLLVSCAARAQAQAPPAPADPPASLYRVFLRDGSTVTSYGEYARVADRVVISLPVGASLQLLSIPADTVDWEKTDAYAESVRATRYAATRGPDEFALLSVEVSHALSEINATADPNRKIAMAIEARQNVTRWAAEHFGFRAAGVAEMASMFDEVIAQARTQTGVKNFDLSLIANLAAPPTVPLLPAPSLQESMEQAVAAAALSPEATERTSLLRAVQRALDESAADAPWASVLRARVGAALTVEERATRSYEALTRTTLQAAERYARMADVTGVERVIRRALSEDDRLGQRRPQEMASLLGMLDAKLDGARRLRLARDNWAARSEIIRQFRAGLEEPLALMRLSRESLDEIQRLAGPPLLRLTRLVSRASAAQTLLATMTVPAEGTTVHSLLRSAAQLAGRAAETRRRAVFSGDMKSAWEAASAASGALMLFDRAAEELQKLAAPVLVQTPR